MTSGRPRRLSVDEHARYALDLWIPHVEKKFKKIELLTLLHIQNSAKGDRILKKIRNVYAPDKGYCFPLPLVSKIDGIAWYYLTADPKKVVQPGFRAEKMANGMKRFQFTHDDFMEINKEKLGPAARDAVENRVKFDAAFRMFFDMYIQEQERLIANMTAEERAEIEHLMMPNGGNGNSG